ncbi:putative undecaprenyl diphosphate synthase domain-containing protein [Ditylenchus destructor]|uniref:Alkyl transferase n=1 Tax=Ditylenchus destructor TaxID=166010 RepID=A0AAD4MHM8_9BILA|nr:putative undecaprenyl diphosphate synthase domain-containing protein [Ditylenchus destructor]
MPLLEDQTFAGESEWFQEEEAVGLPWWGTLGKHLLQLGKMPNHIAFVMDGNRRYARKNNLGSVVKGHSRGFEQMTKVLEWCRELGVREVTVYAFSIENFKRSEEEVTGLMQLAEKKFEKLLADKEKLQEKQICFRFFGDMKLLPRKIQKLVSEIESLTKDYTQGFVNVCIAYTSQNEIARAMEWIRRGTQMGLVQTDDITESLISRCLDTRNSSEVDMLIRTSGERRLSDFLLWQVFLLLVNRAGRQ